MDGPSKKKSSVMDRLRVLVVDDSHDAADSCAMILELDGFDVRTAYGSEQALEILGHFWPDLAFLDIGMPVMDGRELAETIRASGKEIALVSLSGWGTPEDVARNKAAGFDHHITKPASAETISSMAASIQRGPGAT